MRKHYGWAILLLGMTATAHAETPQAAPANSATSASQDAQNVQFDPSFLAGQAVDVTRFERDNPVMPGTYMVDLYVNGELIGHRAVKFEAHGKGSAQPLLTRSLLEAAGVDLSQWKSTKDDAGQPVNLAERIPGASLHYDSSDQHLELSIPQIAMRHTDRGWIAPSRWDSGITAGILKYDFNAYRSMGNGAPDDSMYLGLMAGFNVGGWRFRDRSALNYDEHGGFQWQQLDAYAQHDITKWKSTLTLGDSSTTGDTFDSFALRGVQLGSDERMLPDSELGYAPVVRGVAHSNAKVEVRQNGYVIYQTTVAPGPFAIRDLNPTGYGGDLRVTITEADGTKRTYSVPYATVPQLLRAGASRYSFAAGQYRGYGEGPDSHPYVFQGIYRRGINNLITGYGGVQASEGYMSALLGAALNTPYGAFALDVTGARTSIPYQPAQTGMSWRLSYAKSLPKTDTNLTVAAYRYSTAGFYSLQDAVNARNAADIGSYPAQELYRSRSRVQLNINQPIGSGSLYAMGSLTDYWNRQGSDLQMQIGYSGTTRWGGYSLSLQRVRDAFGNVDNQIYASVSIPLGANRVDSHPLFSDLDFSVAQGKSTTFNTSASGTAGHNNEWSYGLNAGYSGDNQSKSVGAYGTYNGPKGTVNASASAGTGNSQLSFGMSGSAIVHKGGVTFGQAVGADDAIGLVKAKGAKGAEVTNAPGVAVDGSGYAIVPFLTPYRENTLVLDPSNMSDSAELEETSEDVVPRAGAVVEAKFETKVGVPVIMRVKQANGEPVPMGADVLDTHNQKVGVVGQGGTVYVRGVSPKEPLTVRWSKEPGGTCSFGYTTDGKGHGVAQVCAVPGMQADQKATPKDDHTAKPETSVASAGQH
ncbi:fimbria/pilus outer membrane usher protein [Burkholderia latens]|uniref:fimbria/pilus outer membrane usher protein n=1 Tax=Burkholderia latens TaxID=488446 RepID=UPI00158DF2B3|nr:fimbria/pilus outer membrane usher protein [Burkholderia latens]